MTAPIIQIKYESFVEDINNLLNSGEVPNLFTKEDMGEICEKIAADAKKARGVETPEGQVPCLVPDEAMQEPLSSVHFRIHSHTRKLRVESWAYSYLFCLHMDSQRFSLCIIY